MTSHVCRRHHMTSGSRAVERQNSCIITLYNCFVGIFQTSPETFLGDSASLVAYPMWLDPVHYFRMPLNTQIVLFENFGMAFKWT